MNNIFQLLVCSLLQPVVWLPEFEARTIILESGEFKLCSICFWACHAIFNLFFVVCLLSCVTCCCYKLLENPTISHVKSKPTRDGIIHLLGVLIKKYNHLLGESVSLWARWSKNSNPLISRIHVWLYNFLNILLSPCILLQVQASKWFSCCNTLSSCPLCLHKQCQCGAQNTASGLSSEKWSGWCAPFLIFFTIVLCDEAIRSSNVTFLTSTEKLVWSRVRSSPEKDQGLKPLLPFFRNSARWSRN